MRSVKFLIAAGAASLLSTAAFAADMPSIMPAPQYYAPPPQDFGGWYLRGDVGITSQHATNISNPLDTTLNVTGPSYAGTGLSGAGTWDVGVGYAFNSWLRGDITAEYRNAASLKGSVYGQFSAFGGTFSDVDNYSANLSSLVFLANAYIDLGTWFCLTPFVGVGAGMAQHRFSGMTDVGYISDGTTGFGYAAADSSEWKFAWALHAGVAYNVTNNFKMELAYRYLNMGDVNTSIINCASSGCVSNGPRAFYTMQNFDAQEIKFGMRWMLQPEQQQQPAYMPPLVRKG